jgi:hypothetical protein
VLHVKNDDAPGDGMKHQFLAKLYFDGGEYNIALQEMEAGQTVEIDLKKLRDDQVKDVLGNLIPLTVTGGQLDWQGRANKGQFIGRLAEYDPVAGVASSFSCANCPCDPGFGSGEITPDISGFVDDTFTLTAIETDTDCSGAIAFTYSVSADFASTDESVVTVSGSTATLVDAGSASITASWDASFMHTHCFFTAEGDCNDARCDLSQVVNPIANKGVTAASPDHLVDLAEVMGPTNMLPDGTTCGGNYYLRQVRFQVVSNDSNGDKPVGHVFEMEQFDSVTTNTCGNGQPPPTDCTSSDSNGTFIDTITVNCLGRLGPPDCGYDITYGWYWCGSGSQGIVKLASLNAEVRRDSVKLNGLATAWPQGTAFRR